MRSNSTVSLSKLKVVPTIPPLVLSAKAEVCGLPTSKGGRVGKPSSVGASDTISATVGWIVGVNEGSGCGVVSKGIGVTVMMPSSGMVASAVIKVGVTSNVGGGGGVNRSSVGTRVGKLGAGVLKSANSSGESVRVGVEVGSGVMLGV